MGSVPIVAPDGSVGDVPFEHMMDAIKAGGKPGVTVKSPDGKLGVVPSDRMGDAVKAGGTVVPLQDQETQHPGFWATAANDLKGLLHPAGFSPYPGMDTDAKSAAATRAAQQDQSRKEAGYSLPYRALAPVAQSVGVNVPGMEESAKEGDVAGVAGHAAVPAAVMAATTAGAHILSKPGPPSPKYPGAPLPETPTPELVQAQPLTQGGAAPSPEPAAALDKVPVQPVYPGGAMPEHPGTFPGAPEPNLPPEARLPEAFQPLPAKPPAVPGTTDQPFQSIDNLPASATHQAVEELGPKASVPQITERANQIALKTQLGDQLNQAVGYKPPTLTSGKPIYQRPMPSYTPEAPIPVPEGMTPVESSALRSYHYDPDTGTFTGQMRSGSMYRWAEVTPDEAQAFADAKSKGQALQDIRNNHVNTQANYGQGWINRNPAQRSASPTDIAPGTEAPTSSVASSDLTAILQKSLEQARASGKLRTVGQSNATPQAAPSSEDSASAVAPQPANGRTGPGATVYEPRQPELPTASGARTNVTVPGSDQSYPATYEVRELSDVQPSHSGATFQPNPKYALTNDRDYTNPVNQAKVIEASAPGKFDASYHLTDNPDATNGPIVIDSDGHALGGNGRAMMLQRVYQQNPEGASAYRMMLVNKSPQFGVDPMAVLKMKQPVLVRNIADEDLPHIAQKQSAITDFNKVGTAQMTSAERAIADSRRVSQSTLEAISSRIEAQGPEATLTDALQGKSGTEILDRLIDDGVVSPQERAALATDNSLTSAGKERISKLTTGRFFRDPAQMDSTPQTVRSKLEAIAAPLARVEGIPGWELTPNVQQALDLLEEARTHNLANVMDAVSQSRLFGDAKYSPRAIALAEQLKNTGTRTLVKQLRQYAQDAQDATGMQQTFASPVTPQQAFREAFNR